MIRRTTAPRAACFILAALPLAIQITSEARQAAAPAATAAQSATLFETSVRPVLAANCYDCHGEERMGGLRVDSREGLLKGGKSGPAIVPGDPEKSLLIQAVRQTQALKMPKGGRLKPAEVDALTEWVKAGAIWPAFAPSSTPTGASPAASAGKPVLRRQRRRTSSRRSSGRSGRSSRFRSRRFRRCRMRRGRRPTSTAMCSRVSSARGWRQ